MGEWELVSTAFIKGEAVVDTERQKVPGGWLYRAHTYKYRQICTLNWATPYSWEVWRSGSQTNFVPEVRNDV